MYFIIPSSTGLVASNTTITVDKNAARESVARVRKAQFGDGYSHRIADGINSLSEKFSVSFSPRHKSEIDNIANYFALLKGVTALTLFVPNTNGDETIKVTCESWNKVYLRDEYYSLDTVFERVYEA
tara:strand:+ start:275 stop:655 length:381 start_codon:yes stop_codon:yes gene_type:complete